MDYSENADILGQPTLPIVSQETQAAKLSTTKSILVLFTLLGCYVIGMRIRRQILIWREKAYKMETRRRHGIPDSDRRPFNVAYAAAMLAREEREKDKKNSARRQLSRPVQTPAADSSETHGIRHRSDRLRSTTSVPVPGAFVPSYVANPTAANFRTEHVPSPSRSGFNEPQRRTLAQSKPDYQPTHSRHAARNFIDLTSDGESPKRGLDDEDWDDGEPLKKSRIEGEEPIDGDEDPSWDTRGTAPKRPAKRTLVNDDEIDEGIRDKRARKISLDKNGKVEVEVMDVDEELDEVPDLSPVRGKKRDRAEAGSTFGGDDDGSGHEDDAKARRNRRKRRTFAKRKSDVGISFSRKRDRDVEMDDEEMGSPSEVGRQSRRRKKGKRHSNTYHGDDHANGSDISVDDSLASSSTRGRHRQIGEEWESHGVRYKVGPNGQKLRQALVKRARSKFSMPKDSIHPDRNANLEVFVETWLTEQEFSEAKEQTLLAWQDSPKQSAEPENLSVEIPPAKSTPVRPVGKNLLWQSTVGTPTTSPGPGSPMDSPLDISSIRPKGLRNPGRYSLGASAGLRVNPFEKASSISAKRIASTSLVNAPLAASANGLSDKTNSYIRPRNLSKWEKQEAEARAISQLRAVKQAEIDAKEKVEREKAQKEKELKERIERERQEQERQERERQEKARQEKERQEKERKEKEAAAAAAAAAPQIPSITITQPAETKPAPASAFSFGPAPLTNAAPSATAPSAGSAPSGNLFGPSAATASSKPEDKKPGSLFAFKPPAPAAAPATGTAPSAFSFGPSTSNTASAAISNPFGAPAAPAAAKPEEKKDPPGGSLFSRISPAGADASKPAGTGAPASGGLFSFKPPAIGATGGSVFGQPPGTTGTTGVSALGQPANTTTPASTAAPTASSTTVPGFNPFGPPKTGGAAASSTSSTATNGAAGDNKGPSFSFKPPAAARTDASKPSTTAPAAAGPNKFGFGAPSAFGSTGTTGSVFGSTNTFGSSNPASTGTTSTASNTTVPAPATSTFGAAPSTFAFGNQDKGKEPAKSAFGTFGGGSNTNTGGTFGGAGNTGNSGNGIFGAASKPAAAANGTSAPGGTSKFSFSAPAANGASATTTTPAAAEMPKPSFNFAAGAKPGTTTTTAPASSSPFNFNFSKPGPGTTTPQSTTTPASVFGAATTTPTMGTPSGGVFGGPSQPLSAFGFGTPTGGGGAGTTTPAGTPLFSFGTKG